MKLPRPDRKHYTDLINDIENGRMQVPQFQREFVWDIEKSAKLLDSIIKGYPIGTFIIWKTTDRLKTVGELGKYVSRQPEPGEPVQYILDGQQRITTLFVALNGYRVNNTDYSSIYINLSEDCEDDIVITDVTDLPNDSYISFTELLSSNITDLVDNYDKTHLKKIDYIKQIINGYEFPIIELTDTPIEVATEIFTRINVQGKPLSVFEIMCARIFDVNSGFDLEEKYNEFLEKLEQNGFNTIPPTIPLQLVSLYLTKNCKSKTILSLKKDEVIGNWELCCGAIYAAVDYVRATFCVPNSEMLPYYVMLIPIAYYMIRRNVNHPSVEDDKCLRDMFWRYALTQRYNNATESKLAADVEMIDSMIDSGEYKPAVPIELSERFFQDNGSFVISRGFTKAMLCFYLSKLPLRLDSYNTRVLTDNRELIKGNGKNYHHFFPKAYMKKCGYDEPLVNNIVNIIIVDDYTNKYKIRDKAPSVYIQELKKSNDKIGIALASHLIGNPDDFGITDDNYQLFYHKRVEWIISELSEQMLLASEVNPDDEADIIEMPDSSASAAYANYWNQLTEALLNSERKLLFNEDAAQRIKTVTILPNKVDMRFVISASKQVLSCELVCRDDSIYQKFFMQRDDFDAVNKPYRFIWPDQDAKTKRLICEYPNIFDVYDTRKYPKYNTWIEQIGCLLQENVQLFLEDMEMSKGTAADEIEDPVIVYCNSRSTSAQGRYLGKRLGFEILAGSQVKLSTRAYGASERKRGELVADGTIKRLPDGKGEFTKSYVCSTPSQASDILLGGSNNGWITWRDENNVTLDSLYRNRA